MGRLGAWPSEKRSRFLRCLQVHIDPQRGGVFQAEGEAVEGLARGLGFGVPEGREVIPDIDLIEFGNRNAAELGENVQLERTEPAAGDAVAFQLRLSTFEGVARDIAKEMQVPGRVPPALLPFLDRIKTGTDFPSGFLRRLSCLGQWHCGVGTETHLPTPPVNDDPEHPFPTGAMVFHEPKACSIGMFAWFEAGRTTGSKAVGLSHPLKCIGGFGPPRSPPFCLRSSEK